MSKAQPWFVTSHGFLTTCSRQKEARSQSFQTPKKRPGIHCGYRVIFRMAARTGFEPVNAALRGLWLQPLAERAMCHQIYHRMETKSSGCLGLRSNLYSIFKEKWEIQLDRKGIGLGFSLFNQPRLGLNRQFFRIRQGGMALPHGRVLAGCMALMAAVLLELFDRFFNLLGGLAG